MKDFEVDEVSIGIIGGGSLGLLISSYLSLNDNVTLYVRRRVQYKAIKQAGIILEREHIRERDVNVTVRVIDDLRAHQVMFITVKQPHIDDIIPRLHAMQQSDKIIFLQNGMGHIEKINSLQSETYVGVVEHGATRTADNVVNHLGFGTIKLAAFNERATKLVNLQQKLNDESFPFEISNDWKQLLREKLLINAVINPLTTLFDGPNGIVIENDYIMKLAKELTDETASILELNQAQAWENVERVARNTRKNTSSMRADILHGRETEIEAISGYLLKRSTPAQMPYTSFVYHAILALQEKHTLVNEDK